MNKKNQDQISTSKIGRASKIASAGFKVGGNYLKYYAKKFINSDTKRDELDSENAKDLYKTLSELKGGPLKIAQMLSMTEEMLPKAYTQQFGQAQNRVMPLSYPLIRRTIKKGLGKSIESIFDDFSQHAVNAASIGQVHRATIKDQTFAVKIQYPGVADSIQSDIRMVKPLAVQLFGLDSKQIEPYMKEVEAKLYEETDYDYELRQSQFISDACKHLENVSFPTYYPEYSGNKILTMSWMDGIPFTDWLNSNPSQEARNQVGQTLWDFYQFQIHTLHLLHADPHPGNFLIGKNNELQVIDFGCTKELPADFYASYIKLLDPELLEDTPRLVNVLKELEVFDESEPQEVKDLVMVVFSSLFNLVSIPFYQKTFDFSDPKYFEEIYKTGEQIQQNKELRSVSARGSRHFIYFNRTYFGLYQLLHLLKANISTYQPYTSQKENKA